MFTHGTPVRVTLTTTDQDCGIGYLKAVIGLGWAILETSQGASYRLESTIHRI